MFRIIFTFIFLVSFSGLCQDRPRLTLQTVSQLGTRNPFPNEVAEVASYATNGDWSQVYVFRWDATNTLPTNGIRIKAAPAVGRYVHDWNGNADVFGVASYYVSTNIDTPVMVVRDSAAALQGAIDAMYEKGGGTIKLPSGTIQLRRSVFLRPRVCLEGAGGAANGFVGRYDRNQGLTYLETITSDGFGVPPLVLDGPTYYTNELAQPYTNQDGDTITYYSGVNTIKDIVFTTYQVGAGGTNRFPVAGVLINQVDGVTIQGCGFVNIRGYGIWALGPRGLRVLDNAFINCVTASWFVAYASDTSYHRNLAGGSGVLFYRANTIEMQANEVWNPYWSSVDNFGTTNLNAYGLVRPMNRYHTQVASAINNTVTQTTGNWKADTGAMVKFVGSSPPSPFVIDKPYFLINGSSASEMKVAASPSAALAGTAIDITSDATNGTWRLTGWTDAVYARECEEVTVGNQRSEQSYQNTITFDTCTRSDIFGCKLWEIGTHQGPQRAIAFSGNLLFAGIYLMNCDAIDVQGNKFQGGYNFGSSVNNIAGEYYGVYATNCSDVNVIGNSLLSLKAGTYADQGCFNVRTYGNAVGADVYRVADSYNTNGANDRIWAGLNQNGTNPVVSADIPAAFTNLTDFSLHINLMTGTPQVSGSGDSYNPLFHLGPSTNYTGSAYNSLEGTLRSTLFRGSGQTNWSLFVDIVGASNSYMRAAIPVHNHIDSGHPFDITLVRSGPTWGLLRAGYWRLFSFDFTNGPTPPTYSQTIHAKNFILGFWPTEIFRTGWASEAILLNRASTSFEAQDFRNRALGTNGVFAWDFKGDTLNTVRDKSGNGVHGTVVNLSTNVPHEWGPWYEYNPTPVLASATVVSNTLNSARREALSGEAPGLLFRGSGYVTANNIPNLGTSNFTVWSRFVMPTTGTNDSQTPWCLSAATNSGNTARVVYLQCLTNGNVEVLLTGSSTSHGLKAIAAGARTRHAGQVVDFIFSRSNSTPYIWINGTNETLTSGGFGTPPTWADTVTSTNVIVGTGSQAFLGRIFRTAVWNRAFTQSDVNSLFVNGISDSDRWTTPTGAPGAFIDLNLGIGSGASIPDRSTNAYNGLLVGSAEHLQK